MKKFSLLLFVLLGFSLSAAETSVEKPTNSSEKSPVKVSADAEFEIGFHVGGWNTAKFVFENQDTQAWEIVKMDSSWKDTAKRWPSDVNKVVAAGESLKWLYPTYYSEDFHKGQNYGPIVMEGIFTLRPAGSTNEAKNISLPFTLTTKKATLEEDLATITGKFVRVSFQKSRFDGKEWQKEMLQWMDEVYVCMEDLTGRRPFDGANLELRETPSRKAWAYAGNPVVLNSLYVPTTIEEFKEGLMSWGWAHETGHNFDCDLKDFLRWNSPSTEFQANIKVLYAFEHMPSSKYLDIRWKGLPGYPRAPKEREAISELGNHYFLFFGDEYLANPERTWDTMSSDDILSLFLRVVRVYGWDVIKKWYRIIGQVKDSGKEPPKTPEEKVNFVMAALNEAVGQNLIKTYQLWRLPITQESLKETKERYGL